MPSSKSFKGYRITSTDPLTIEAYTDSYNSDAELNILTLWPINLLTASPARIAGRCWQSPIWQRRTRNWLTPSDKADLLKVEETSWVGGPSLEILSKYLDQAESESYIPYEPTLGQYITKEEAAQRYANLKKWYQDHGHFWVGTGPYYLDKVFPTEKSLVLKHNPDFPDKADRWAQFAEPRIAETTLDGPGQIKAGEEAVFDAFVTFRTSLTHRPISGT